MAAMVAAKEGAMLIRSLAALTMALLLQLGGCSNASKQSTLDDVERHHNEMLQRGGSGGM
jgi:hypothetical protein